MGRYLLAAEVDKIQDFIFRSSRLREVVGGSQLLSRFCKEVPRYLLPHYGGNPDADIITSDGGSFRILFNDAGQAQDFGNRLAEVYRFATGGTLTVAKPVEVGSAFSQASTKADEELRRAKRWREGWQAQEQLPFMAICASCGMGLAVEYRKYYDNENYQYVCAACLHKSAEKKDDSFLAEFQDEILGDTGLARFDWPSLEDVARYDRRRYVAYLLADGNSMGEIFNQCLRPEQMTGLSKRLGQAMRRALAKPTQKSWLKINWQTATLFIRFCH